MIHMVGYETSASQAALTAITPIPDGTVQIQNNDIFVPDGLNYMCAAASLINSAAATLRAEVQSPSLRAMLNFDISPINNGLVFGSLPRCNRMLQSPVPLKVGEPLDVFVQNGAAVMNRAFLLLGDGPVQKVTGPAFTVRATGAATLVTASWVNTVLTFGQTLPSGTFQCIGFRSWGANLVASRIFFKGATWRPGWFAGNSEDNNEWETFRYGNPGVLGQFTNLVPPSIDCMGVTDSAQVFFLDLIKVA
jgi:hypothetical protein